MSALTGIHVLDLSIALAGPYCTMMLGDYGADVIKIERPGTGDDTRLWAPPYIDGQSAYFVSVNRNKRSVTLNLKHPRGREIFLRMAEEADVVVENFRPGVVARLGVDYEAVRKVNGQIVYCSISGFGQTGPYLHKPAYDQIMQGLGGLMSMTGEPGGGPVKTGVAITDIGAGMFAAYGILAALLDRHRTGQGQHVDVAMLDCQVAWLTYQAQGFLATGKAPGKVGAAHPTIVPYQAFACRDGKYINVAVGSERLWPRFCKAVGREELQDDPRFANNDERVKNRGQLVPELEQMFLQRPSAEWLEMLEGEGVPCGPIQDVSEVLSDPQVLSREMLVEIPHPAIGPLRLTGVPVKLSRSPGSIRHHPPLLGEHTEEVLKELLGVSDAELAALREEEVV